MLQAASALREETHPAATHTGGLWQRNQHLLARALRLAGRSDEARKVEDELAATLAVADADHPLRAPGLAGGP